MTFGLLLLQKTVTIQREELTAVYIGLVGTIISALLAAFISFRASNKSSATTHEVARLTTQTTRDAATIASMTAKELKAKDYQDDFYKKIIDRRFKAWEEAAAVMELANEVVSSATIRRKLFSFFLTSAKFDEVVSSLGALSVKAMWLGIDFGHAMKALYMTLLSIRKEVASNSKAAPSGLSLVDEKLLKRAGLIYYEQVDAALALCIAAAGKELKNLSDVPTFLSQLPSVPEQVDES